MSAGDCRIKMDLVLELVCALVLILDHGRPVGRRQPDAGHRFAASNTVLASSHALVA